MSLAQLWDAYQEHGYRADQPIGTDPLDQFYGALLAFGHQDLARAAELARQAAAGDPDDRVFTEAAAYLGRVAHQGKHHVYVSGDAFAAFIGGGGNVPLYAATSAALRAAYAEHERLDVLDIGVGNGHALLPALTPTIDRLGVVEPSAALLADLRERLEAIGRPIDAFAGTAQEFAHHDNGGWTIIQATYSLHSIPPEERPGLLRRLRDLGQRLLIVEFDVPEFATMYDPARVRDIVGRYQRGLAEYTDDGGLVAQGFLMPVLLGYFDQTAARTTYEVSAYDFGTGIR
ncbi:class I SAM-dependent methyltransferase [Herpetosiphon geysericola]|uniref:class I SAM-dependent methyltransferase n=1 Tax=Herpetosiphon geysericola TaxID=70996 RepID=UPI0006C92F8B|nr:class I SAM-dependent methyltransferase [Herpetosiphon geysericola]